VKREKRQELSTGYSAIFPVFSLSAEHVPLEGGVIVATNHLSRLDIPVLFPEPCPPGYNGAGDRQIPDYPLFRWFANTANGIWIDRTKADLLLFREAADAAKGRLCRISRRNPKRQRCPSGRQVWYGFAGAQGGCFRSYRLASPELNRLLGQCWPSGNRSYARFGPALNWILLDRSNRMRP